MRRALAVLAAWAAACGAPEPARFPVRFVAQSDGTAIEGVRIAVGGAEIGRTDQRGVLDVALIGKEGDTVRLSAVCPEGYRVGGELPPLVLRRLTPLGASGRTERVRIAVPCRPEERTVMLLVRADGEEDLPILIDGREVARTDEHGLAHVQLAYAPHTSFEVVLRTDDRPELSPHNPPHVFTVPDDDRVFVVDQRFVRPEAERPRTRRVRQPVRQPDLPVRITSDRGRRGTRRIR